VPHSAKSDHPTAYPEPRTKRKYTSLFSISLWNKENSQSNSFHEFQSIISSHCESQYNYSKDEDYPIKSDDEKQRMEWEETLNGVTTSLSCPGGNSKNLQSCPSAEPVIFNNILQLTKLTINN